MMVCRNKVELDATIPIFLKMANADRLLCLGLFQAAIDTLLDERYIKEFACMIILVMFKKLPTMKWDVVSEDSAAMG